MERVERAGCPSVKDVVVVDARVHQKKKKKRGWEGKEKGLERDA